MKILMILLAMAVAAHGEPSSLVSRVIERFEVRNKLPYDALVLLVEEASASHPGAKPVSFVFAGNRDVLGLVTMDLHKVPFAQAVVLLCKSAGLQHEFLGDAVIVRTAEFSSLARATELFVRGDKFSAFGVEDLSPESIVKIQEACKVVSPDLLEGMQFSGSRDGRTVLIEGPPDSVSTVVSILNLGNAGLLKAVAVQGVQ